MFRFAPSPNGYLHLGHALSALINADAARALRRKASRCASRISTRRAAARNSRRRSSRISNGSAWLSSGRCGARASIWRFTASASRRSSGAASSIPASARARRSAAPSPTREARDGEKWPRDPDGAFLYPGICRELEPNEAAKRDRAPESRMPGAFARRGERVPAGSPGASMRRPSPRSPWRAIEADPLGLGRCDPAAPRRAVELSPRRHDR